MKSCQSCHQPESEELIFRGEKCRVCYNAERLAYYYNFTKNGTQKPRPNQLEPIKGLIICKECSTAKKVKHFYISAKVGDKVYYRSECKECVKARLLEQYHKIIRNTFNFRNAIVTMRDGSVIKYNEQGIAV